MHSSIPGLPIPSSSLIGALGRSAVVAGSCLLAGAALAQVSTTERQALIALYETTNGDEWINNDGWLGEEGTECEWHGVNCREIDTGSQYVHRLLLSNNGLDGNLPEDLVDLDRLVGLSLDNNNLHGPIPAEYGEFAALTNLDLSDNGLSGPIPGTLLSGQPLQYIDLGNNRLDGYTESANPVSTARLLALSGNPIGALPPESWRRPYVIGSLELNRTRLTGEIDLDHDSWEGLEQLELADNAITRLVGINAETLIDLTRLDLARNAIAEHWPVSGQTLPELTSLDLRANGLTTPPPTGLSTHPALRELQLANNALTTTGMGELFVLDSLTTLNLANNPIQALPENLPGAPADLSELDLSQGQLSGDTPVWFSELTLRTLDISGNQLAGSLEPWLAAMQGSFNTRLNLSRNQFDGELPAALTETEFANHGLALCWNRFDEPFSEAMASFLETAHRDGSLAKCNDRDQADIDPTISGSWYNPDRPGQGYTVMLLDSGQLLHYWFGYPDVLDTDEDRQMWSFEITAPAGSAAVFPPSLIPYGGRFGQGLAAGQSRPYGDRALEMILLADDRLSVYSGWRVPGRRISISPARPRVHERFDHGRLSRLAGTACDNQGRFQEYSGAWYNPERSGEGFIVEVLPDGRGLVYWFTYVPDGSGSQAWMVGEGMLDGPEITVTVPPSDQLMAEIVIENMIQPVGTELPPNFDSNEIDYVDWGSLRLEFHHDGSARVFWDSQLDGYGSGDYPIERLARPKLADCEGGDDY